MESVEFNAFLASPFFADAASLSNDGLFEVVTVVLRLCYISKTLKSWMALRGPSLVTTRSLLLRRCLTSFYAALLIDRLVISFFCYKVAPPIFKLAKLQLDRALV